MPCAARAADVVGVQSCPSCKVCETHSPNAIIPAMNRSDRHRGWRYNGSGGVDFRQALPRREYLSSMLLMGKSKLPDWLVNEQSGDAEVDYGATW